MVHDDPPSDVLQRLETAEQLKLDGKHVEALVILEQLLFEDPENIAALEEVADNELSLHHYERAETAAKQAVALDRDSYTGYYILGFLRSHAEQWPEAVVHLRRSNALKPNNPEILRCLGWALFSDGERAQGVVTLERALNLESDNTLILCDLGIAYLQLRNFAKSKSLFLRALDLDPGNLRARECIQALERLRSMLSEQTVTARRGKA
ncbi:MAG: tetratricopeptide repeat protein [Candidatus Peribacteraceae bacterium]|nr:tetratricopeptide repeat protein [Candidatus Peribacteraceae bacterium]